MKSFFIIGLDEFGRTMALDLMRQGAQVMVIDSAEEEVSEIADQVINAVVGDPTNPDFLLAAGVKDYECAVVCRSRKIDESLLITLALKDIGVKKVVAKAFNDQHLRILQKVGADKVVFPDRDRAKSLAFTLSRNYVTDYINFSDEYSIVTMDVPDYWVGKTVAELNIRKNMGINIIALKNPADEKPSVLISPSHQFSAGESVTVMGLKQSVEKITE